GCGRNPRATQAGYVGRGRCYACARAFPRPASTSPQGSLWRGTNPLYLKFFLKELQPQGTTGFDGGASQPFTVTKVAPPAVHARPGAPTPAVALRAPSPGLLEEIYNPGD